MQSLLKQYTFYENRPSARQNRSKTIKGPKHNGNVFSAHVTVLGRHRRSLEWCFLHRDLFPGLSVVFHWCIPHCPDDYRFRTVLEKGKMNSSVYLSFIRSVLAILASLIINKYFNQFVTLHKKKTPF